MSHGVTEISGIHEFKASDDVAAMMAAVQARGGKAVYFGLGTELKAVHHNPVFRFRRAGAADRRRRVRRSRQAGRGAAHERLRSLSWPTAGLRFRAASRRSTSPSTANASPRSPNLARCAAPKRSTCLGRLVLPGAIDMHVHFREPGFEHKEDFSHGTAAAACGGVTTICDMPNTHPPVIDPGRFRDKLMRVAPGAHVDFGLWAGGTRTEHFAALDALGAIGLKVYMNRAVRATDPYAGELSMPDDGTFVKALKAAAELDWPVCGARGEFVHRRSETGGVPGRRLARSRGRVLFLSLAGKRRGAEPRGAVREARRRAPAHCPYLAQCDERHRRADRRAPRRRADHRGSRAPGAQLCRTAGTGDEGHPVRPSDRRARSLLERARRRRDRCGRDRPRAAHARGEGRWAQQSLDSSARLSGRRDIAPDHGRCHAARTGSASTCSSRSMAENPARILGLREKGAIVPGRDADLVVVDPDGGMGGRRGPAAQQGRAGAPFTAGG